MGLLDFITGGAGSLVKSVGDVVDKLTTSDAEKAAAKLEVEKLILARDTMLQDAITKEIEAKKDIIVAEMQQSDAYTKRARPTIVYAGLSFIFLNYVLLPFIFAIMEMCGYQRPTLSLALPDQFWYVWGGVCSVWMIGRTIEKTGGQVKMPWEK